MISAYLGTPGAGKSLHVASEIRKALKSGHLVIANFCINLSTFKIHSKSKFVDFDNEQIRWGDGPDKLINECASYLNEFPERRIYIVLDEAQLLFDSRTWNVEGRSDWLYFFSQHRKYCGFDSKIILVTQSLKSIDKRIQNLVEYAFIHRNLKYGNTFEFFISMIFGWNLFAYTKIWYASLRSRDVVETRLYIGHKKLFEFYDTTKIFTYHK